MHISFTTPPNPIIPKPNVSQLNEEYCAKIVLNNNLKRSSKLITFQTPKTDRIWKFFHLQCLCIFPSVRTLPSSWTVLWYQFYANPRRIGTLDLQRLWFPKWLVQWSSQKWRATSKNSLNDHNQNQESASWFSDEWMNARIFEYKSLIFNGTNKSSRFACKLFKFQVVPQLAVEHLEYINLVLYILHT